MFVVCGHGYSYHLGEQQCFQIRFDTFGSIRFSKLLAKFWFDGARYHHSSASLTNFLSNSRHRKIMSMCLFGAISFAPATFRSVWWFLLCFLVSFSLSASILIVTHHFDSIGHAIYTRQIIKQVYIYQYFLATVCILFKEITHSEISAVSENKYWHL